MIRIAGTDQRPVRVSASRALDLGQDTEEMGSEWSSGIPHGDDLDDGNRRLGPAAGIFYAWWRGDPLPEIEKVPGLSVAPYDAGSDLAIMPPGAETCAARLAAGHHAYLARVDGRVVASGWSSWRSASIGELGIEFPLSPDERYLWDFQTAPDWRGRNIYPTMLQAIVRIEADAERFLIGHDLENQASASGILRAGFQPVATYHPAAGVLAPVGPAERAAAVSRLVGIPLSGGPACGDSHASSAGTSSP